MKLASFNVENLFQRARALNQATWSDGRDALKKHAALNGVLNKQKYTAADKAKIVTLMTELGIDKKDDGGQFVILRQNRGKLLKRPKSGVIEVVAEGRGDWVGWVDLKIEEVNELAIQNTARVMNDVDPDVLAVVEAESRPALLRFSEHVIPAAGGRRFEHIMLIDGNDERGIDVGLMTREGYEISLMRSHVDDRDATGIVFSRDCAEYHIRTPTGSEVVLLINHFKSKGFGSQAANDAKRKRQVARVKQIYEGLLADGIANVAVLGDFNDTPDSEPLGPLLKQTNLRDIFTHPAFDNGGREGTFGNCAASDKIDYILLSPSLFAATTSGGVFREGIWGGKSGTLFKHYPEITKAGEAASDHAAVWAEIGI
jgi:endonuclease/exonuclease/phosphatase family metal-dependent hydrolase